MKIPVEKGIYYFVWTSCVLYSLLRFCKAVNYEIKSLDPSDFADGWRFLQRKKDTSDVEWIALTFAFKKYWALIFLQIIFTQVLLAKHAKVLPAFYAIYPVLCLLLIVGPYITALYLFYILLSYSLHIYGYKFFCYAITAASLYLLHQECFFKLRNSITEEMEGFLVDVGSFWLVARCLSFSIDRINSDVNGVINIKHITLIISYCLYLPAVFTGPLLSYQMFVKQVLAPKKGWTFQNACKVLWLFIHPFSSYFLLEFLLHYVYSSAVQYSPQVVVGFNSWALCGLGYALPAMFYLKYFIIYSLAVAFAKMEHFEFPPPPKCISRIHLPSLLWRTFDRGLYLYILRYVYFPLINGKYTVFRKVLASVLCFSFVCIWHGADKAVCTWTVLNFCGVSLEASASALFSTSWFKKYEGNFSLKNKKRFRALMATPQFMLMCISCTFFLSNSDIGKLMFQRILFNGKVPLLLTAFIMYCGCHVSTDVKEIEDKKH